MGFSLTVRKSKKFSKIRKRLKPENRQPWNLIVRKTKKEGKKNLFMRSKNFPRKALTGNRKGRKKKGSSQKRFLSNLPVKLGQKQSRIDERLNFRYLSQNWVMRTPAVSSVKKGRR